jgi:hypothetical protein
VMCTPPSSSCGGHVALGHIWGPLGPIPDVPEIRQLGVSSDGSGISKRYHICVLVNKTKISILSSPWP